MGFSLGDEIDDELDWPVKCKGRANRKLPLHSSLLHSWHLDSRRIEKTTNSFAAADAAILFSFVFMTAYPGRLPRGATPPSLLLSLIIVVCMAQKELQELLRES